MQISIKGKYVLESSDNFDEYLKSCGVNFFMRTIANAATPTVEIFEEDDMWVIKTVIPMKTVIVKFKFGEEFEADYPDGSGRKVKSVATRDGNIITQIQNSSDGETLSDIREFTDEGMRITLEHDGIVCKRVYKRVE